MIKMKMAVLALILLVGSVGVEAQRGGGRGGGRMGGGGGGGMQANPEMAERMRNQMQALRAFPASQIWAALSLGLDLPDDKLIAMRVIMVDAWKKRNAWLLHAQEHGNWREVRDELNDLRKSVNKQIKSMLDKKQQKALKSLMKEAERANRSGRR